MVRECKGLQPFQICKGLKRLPVNPKKKKLQGVSKAG
jgi:hypothetical protein